MRNTPALVLLSGLSVCGAPMVGPAEPAVEVATDRESYQMGSTGVLELSNPGSTEVFLRLAGTEPSLCSVALVERKEGDEWVSHPDDCVRQAVLTYQPLHMDEAIDVAFSVQASVFQAGGTYRFVVAASKGREAPAEPYYSNAFSVTD